MSFVRKYVFSTDHKMIGKQFLWAGLAFLLLGGLLAMLIRWQWAFPGEAAPGMSMIIRRTAGIVSPSAYQSTFTLHGLIMIFWAITPIAIGAFGNFLIPLLIGAEDMAFPKLNALSFWVFLLSGLVLLSAFFVPNGTASAGWTTYPPLSTPVGTPGLGQTLIVLAIFLTGASSVMGGVNYITTIVKMRAPGMTWLRLPLTIWGLFLTAILNVLFVPVLGAATMLLLFDRLFGTQFFIAGASAVGRGGDPILYQHLFWIFGHPEVYILILPVWGFVSDLLAFFSRKPAYWYRGSVGSLVLVTVLSGLVYGHHMYQAGIAPLLGKGFMVLTVLISVPGMVLVMNWLNTMRGGTLRFHSPMLFAMGTVFVFSFGGITGLSLAAVLTDIYLHDTMYVVGHFHLTMAAATFLGSFAALHFWFPKMFGRMMNEPLAKAHFWSSVILVTVVFTGQLMAGYAGQQRRLADPYAYDFLKQLLPLNRATSYFAFALGLSQLLFVFNFFYSLVKGKPAPENPWQVGTLEYTPHGTVRRGPHELSNPELTKALHRDWVGQAEELPEWAEELPR